MPGKKIQLLQYGSKVAGKERGGRYGLPCEAGGLLVSGRASCISVLRFPLWCQSRWLLVTSTTPLVSIIALRYRLSYDNHGMDFYFPFWAGTLNKVCPMLAVPVAGKDIALEPQKVPRSKARGIGREQRPGGRRCRRPHLAQLLPKDALEEKGGERLLSRW